MTGPRIPHPFDSSILDSIKEDAAQPQQMPDPMPNIPYTSMPKEAWQEYLQEKLHEHRAGLNPKAMLGIQKAVHALNQYESQAIAPTGGSLLMSELKGAAKFPENAVRGTAGLLDDLVEGKFNKANRDIIEGVGQFGAGLGKLPAAALHAAVGDELPSRNELSSRAEQFGGSTAALGALTAGRALGAKPPAEAEGVEGLGGTINPLPKDIMKMDENQFMEAYRKGTMTPDQMDPYGLNDLKPKTKTPLDDLLKPSKENIKPLTDDELANALNGPNAEDVMANKEAAKAAEKAAAAKDAAHTTALGMIPGVGKYLKLGKMLSVMPDATAVKSSVLTKGGQAGIFRGLTPADTSKKE